jgi:hypothetical protein
MTTTPTGSPNGVPMCACGCGDPLRPPVATLDGKRYNFDCWAKNVGDRPPTRRMSPPPELTPPPLPTAHRSVPFRQR